MINLHYERGMQTLYIHTINNYIYVQHNNLINNVRVGELIYLLSSQFAK